MKNKFIPLILFVAGLLITISSCKKSSDKDVNPQTENPETEDSEIEKYTKTKQYVANIYNYLSKFESVKKFAAQLKDLQITPEDTTLGITIFVPVDDAFTEQSTGRIYHSNPFGRKKLPDSSYVESYIMKGIVYEYDMLDGDKYTALNGDPLNITVQTEGRGRFGTRVNGVKIIDESEDDELVDLFEQMPDWMNIILIDQLLKKEPATATLTVKVMDASGWSLENPNGIPSAGATVSLFRSRIDYTKDAPAYVATTDADGNAIFEKATPWTYFISAENDGMSNIIKEPGFYSEEPNDFNAFTGLAIRSLYQSEDEIEDYWTWGPYSYSGINSKPAPGDLRFRDVNADGNVLSSDFVALPFEWIEGGRGSNSSTTLIIGSVRR